MTFWLKRANLLFFLNQAYQYLCSRFSSGRSWATCSLTGEGLEEGRSTQLYFSARNDSPPPGHPPASLGLFRLGKAKVTVYLNMVSEFISSETYQEPVFLSCSTKFVFIQLNKDP